MKLKDYQLENWQSKGIATAIAVGDIQILLLKINEKKIPPKYGSLNLLAIDTLENIVWIAELPSSPPFGAYDYVALTNHELHAISGSWYCEIDLTNGGIISQELVR
jgi:hypothetical protein